MKINFKVDSSFKIGINRLASYLGYEQAEDGLAVYAVCGDRIGASMKDGVGTIYYKNKHHFFREMGVFIENARKSDHFDITEDSYFETLGIMLNMSNMGVATVKGNKEILDYLAIMGYNMVMLYTEDTIELDTRPQFGLFRGRYSHADIREIDDYAYEYGIEMIPCIECYGHMSSYLKHAEAADIKDTASVLLARNEATFKFLDDWIRNVSSCYRSRRIHVGMDEAHDMGRGKFLDKHGYVPRAQIFNEYMSELVKITDKYGLKPMMWSDMYFRINASDGWQYYEKTIEFPEETKKAFPKGMQLVYWHYSDEPIDDWMIEKHYKLTKKVMFAGGIWDWCGLFPENNLTQITSSQSIRSCRKMGVKEIMPTSWSSQNLYADLLGLSIYAENCYHIDPDEAHRKARFEFCTGASYDAFMCMSNYNNKFGEGEEYPIYHTRFFGKHLFAQDILEGAYDGYLVDRPMSDFYRANAKQMKQYTGGKFDDLYRLAELVFEFLGNKTEAAETLLDAYKAGDKTTLAHISNDLLPVMRAQAEQIRIAHRDLLLRLSTPFVWCELDFFYGGITSRCETAKTLIDAYLSGKIDRLVELEEPRFGKPLVSYGSAMNSALPYRK